MEREKRVALHLPVEVRGEDAGGARFTEYTRSVNVSGGGICFESHRRVAVGTRLQLAIELPVSLRRHFGDKDVYSARAVVCRVERFEGEEVARIGDRFLAASAAALTAAVHAGQAPALTGTWVATKDTPATVALAPSAVFGERFGLVESTDTVVLTRPVRGNAASLVTPLPLDGSEVAVVQTGRQCFGDAVQTNTATRTPAGFDFAITSNTAPGAATTTLAIVYKFRMEGDTLMVESTMRATSGPKQVGTVYRRSSDALPPALKGPNVTVAPATQASRQATHM